MFDVLRNGCYAKLFSAQVVALVGTGLLTVALGLLAFEIAGGRSGVVLGTALTIKMIAYVGVSPVISALTARLPRKPILISADVLRASIALALPFVTEPWHIYVLIFILQSASATFTPTFQAVIPEVLPHEREYTKALSLSRLAYDLESLLSPMLAAALLTVISYNNLFLGTVVGFLGSAYLVLRTKLPKMEPVQPAPFFARLSAGVRVFVSTPELRALMAMNLVTAASTAMIIVNTVVLVQGTLGRTQTDSALLLTANGGGSMLIALALPSLLDRISDRTVMLMGAAVVPLGLVFMRWTINTESWIALLTLWGLLGAATALVLVPSSRLLRRNSNQTNRQAVFATQFSLSHACYLVTYPLAGTLGARFGLSQVAFILAAIALVAAVGAGIAWWIPKGAPKMVSPSA